MLIIFGFTLGILGLLAWEAVNCGLWPPTFLVLFQLAVFLGIAASLIGFFLVATGVI